MSLGQWESSPAEKEALDATIAQFETEYPNIDVQQETVAGDYRAEMITRFGATNAPDLFYVNAEYAQDWIDAGRGKGFIMLGLAVSSDTAARAFADWVRATVNALRVEHLPAGDPFTAVHAGVVRK